MAGGHGITYFESSLKSSFSTRTGSASAPVCSPAPLVGVVSPEAAGFSAIGSFFARRDLLTGALAPGEASVAIDILDCLSKLLLAKIVSGTWGLHVRHCSGMNGPGCRGASLGRWMTID